MAKYSKYGGMKSKSFKLKNRINGISPYIFLTLFGTFIWILTYISIYFYKEFILCYIKSHIKFEGKDYLLNLKEYKSYLPRIFVFNLIIIFFWIIIFLMNSDYRLYIIKSGFICFITLYIVYWCFYHKTNKAKNGFFDDYYTIINFIKNEYFNKYKKDINDDAKEKKE